MRRLCCLLACLSLAASCPPQRGDQLTVTGLDLCIEQVSINVSQDDRSENRTASASGGTAVFRDLGTLVDLRRPLDVTVRVLTTRRTEECVERDLRGAEYRLSGRVTVRPGAEGQPVTATVAASAMTLSRSTRVPELGSTRGGLSPQVRNRGEGSVGIVMWTEPAVNAACTRTCWEQWAQLQVFVIENGVEREVRNGQPWTDPSGNPQVYGRFGRDIPPRSRGNCFREDPIPNVPGRRGIVDAPGFDLTTANARQIFRAGRADSTGEVFTSSFRFTLRSVLICEAPPPRRTLGFYRWSVTQDWAFSRGTDGRRQSRTTYRVDPPVWQQGKIGLEAGITAP